MKINSYKAKWLMFILMIFILMVLISILYIKKDSSSSDSVICSNLNASESNNPKCNDVSLDIANPSFESAYYEAEYDANIDGWNIYDESQNIYLIDENDGDYECYDEEYCLDVNMSRDNKIFTTIDTTGLTGDNKLYFNYFPVDEMSSLIVGLDIKDEKGNVISNVEDPVETTTKYIWQEYELEFNIPTNAKEIEIYFKTDLDSDIYNENVLVDNIQIGQTPVYDITSSVVFEDGLIKVNADISLKSGVGIKHDYLMEINQYVEGESIEINGIEEDPGLIDIEYEVDKKTEEVESTSLRLENLENTRNNNIKLELNMKMYDEENNIIETSSKVEYDNYYALFKSQASIYMKSDIIVTQSAQSESGNDYLTPGEKLITDIVLDNSSSAYSEYNVKIGLSSMKGKLSAEGVKIYDSESELDSSLYYFDNTTETLYMKEIPAGAIYTIRVTKYVGLEDLDNQDEIKSIISYNSSNLSYELINEIEINVDSVYLEDLNVDYKIKGQIDNKTDMDVYLHGDNQNNIQMKLYSMNNKGADNVLVNINNITSDQREMIEGEDYVMSDGIINIYNLNEGEYIKISLTCEYDNYNPLYISYKSEELSDLIREEWVVVEVKEY